MTAAHIELVTTEPLTIHNGRPRSLVHGWGVNDSNQPITKMVEGRQVKCPYYSRWEAMIRRVEKDPSYAGVTICEEWRYFSAFELWMSSQGWQGRELDKDLLSKSSKTYSPETCTFLPNYINRIIVSHKAENSGGLPLGVVDVTKDGTELFKVSLEGGFTPEVYSYGHYTTKEECHQAWQIAKASQLKQAVLEYMVEGSCDLRVVAALLEKAEDIQRDYSNYVETISIL